MDRFSEVLLRGRVTVRERRGLLRPVIAEVATGPATVWREGVRVACELGRRYRDRGYTVRLVTPGARPVALGQVQDGRLVAFAEPREALRGEGR